MFLGLLDHVGILGGLHCGLKELGCKAYHLNLGPERSGQWCFDEMPPVMRLYYRAYQHFHASRERSRFSFVRYLRTAVYLVTLWLLVIWLCLAVDVLFFKSGESLVPSRFDQRLFRWLGKTIVHAYYGSDERPAYLAPGPASEDPETLRARVDATWQRVVAARPYADFVIGNPLSGHFQPTAVCMSQVMGTPLDRRRLEAGRAIGVSIESERDPAAVRVLHAPSLPALKGSDAVREIIARLREEGLAIDYIEVKGRPNAEVMREIEVCDFVIDELYSDDYGAVFSAEAMTFGKPSVVCGYGRAELERLVPPEFVMPTEYAHPDELYSLVRRLLTDAEYRARKSRDAAEYALQQTAPAAVAERFLRLVRGEAPPYWFYDPGEVRYTGGVAAREALIQQRIRSFIEAYGPSALRLDAKPELRDTVIRFARAEAIPSSPQTPAHAQQDCAVTSH